MKIRSALIAATGLGVLVMPMACGPAALTCTASVSKSAPYQNTTVYVYVNTRGNSRVTTVAHYKTTETTDSTYANTAGAASTAYNISRATHGFRVVVTVSVVNGSQTGSCSTAWTTR